LLSMEYGLTSCVMVPISLFCMFAASVFANAARILAGLSKN
jgi:hypothetical protein